MFVKIVYDFYEFVLTFFIVCEYFFENFYEFVLTYMDFVLIFIIYEKTSMTFIIFVNIFIVCEYFLMTFIPDIP